MNFFDWLMAQVEQDGPLGEVARLVRDDRCQQPTNARNHRGLRRHLVHTHQADAEAIDRAYQEYRAAYPRHTAC